MNSTIQLWRVALLPASLGGPTSEGVGDAGGVRCDMQLTAARRDLDWRAAMEQAQLANWFGDECDHQHAKSGPEPASTPAAQDMSGIRADFAEARPTRGAQMLTTAQAIDRETSLSCVAVFGQAAQRYAMVSGNGAAARIDSNEYETQLPAAPSGEPARSYEQAPRLSGVIAAPFVSALAVALSDTLDTGRPYAPAEHASLPAASGGPAPAAARAPDVRVHAQWTQDGVLVWVGIDRDAAIPLAELHAGLTGWLAGRGLRLAGLVCNGRTVELRPRHALTNTGTLENTRAPTVAVPNLLNSEDIL